MSDIKALEKDLKYLSDIATQRGYYNIVDNMLRKRIDDIHSNLPLTDFLQRSGRWLVVIEKGLTKKNYEKLCEILIEGKLAKGTETFFNIYKKKTKKPSII